MCEKALVAIDMQINVNKSKCLRFGARYNCSCAAITLLNGDQVQWTDSCRYLGVYFVSAQSFRCSFHEARASFYRACNGIFGKVCKYASEDVALRLVSEKPRDVSSTIRRAQSSVISYLRFRFTAAYKLFLLCFLFIVMVMHAAGCDKQIFSDASPSVW